MSMGGFRDRPWIERRVKDGQKGPMVWEVKRLRSCRVSVGGPPGEPPRLIVARDVLNPAELKSFAGDAPERTTARSGGRDAAMPWRGSATPSGHGEDSASRASSWQGCPVAEETRPDAVALVAINPVSNGDDGGRTRNHVVANHKRDGNLTRFSPMV